MKNFKIVIFVLLLGFGLCGNTEAQHMTVSKNKNVSLVLTVSGGSLLTAAILQNRADGEWVSSYSSFKNSYTSTYVKPNIFLNTPNNIMFVAGVTLTIAGFVNIFKQ
jgi:hypothetical protein